jgi:5'-nucleotidase
MILLVDMDGPIAHFEQAVYEHMAGMPWTIELADRNFGWVANDYADRFGPDAEQIVRDLCGTAGFFENLPAVEGAADALNELVDRGVNVRVCTSPALWNPTCASAKLEWLEREIGEGWAQRCIITKDKTLARGTYLIDDKPIVDGSEAPQWRHILWQTAYNTQPQLADRYAARMADWSEVWDIFPELRNR